MKQMFLVILLFITIWSTCFSVTNNLPRVVCYFASSWARDRTGNYGWILS